MLSIQHYEFAASCASTDAYISLEHKVGHPRVGNMPWGESVKLLGTIQRSPVGPGWPFFESPQCEHINGVVFTARAGWGLPIVEGSGVVSAGGGVISGGDSVCKSGARGAVVGGSMEGGSPKLKTSLWVLSGWPSLEARVTSVKSAVHDERGSAFFCRNSALRLAFLLLAEGLFLFTASAAGSGSPWWCPRRKQRWSQWWAKRSFDGWSVRGRNPCTERPKKNPPKPFSWKYLNQENEGTGQRYMLLPLLLSDIIHIAYGAAIHPRWHFWHLHSPTLLLFPEPTRMWHFARPFFKDSS